jgi:hypothetical protein
VAKARKPSLDVKKAQDEIEQIMGAFQGVLPHKLLPIFKLTGGKLYELYALSRLLAELRARGWFPYFKGARIELKASPGLIDPNSPHFELQRAPNSQPEYEIFTDIEVGTLGATLKPVNDYSRYHEIDLVVVPAGVTGRPDPEELAFGIECKATANFEKSFVREVLGRRRELSYIHDPLPCPLDLTLTHTVPADPPSEYWLVYIDPAGDNYVESPAVFGVELKNWKP